MQDLISRQAAIEALKNRWKKTRNYEGTGDDIAEECELYLKQLPSAQPEPRWIPCESELPNKYGNYLITTGEGEVDIGTYSPDRPGAWSACDAKGFHWVWDVVAWMPLPKPYERSEDGDRQS